MRRWGLLLGLGLSFVTLLAHADDDLGADEVTLKNGGVIRGTVVSSEPGTAVKIVEYGETKPRTIPWSEVSDVERGKYAKKPTVQPGPTEGYDEPKKKTPARQQPERTTEEAPSTSQAGVIRLHIDSPNNAVLREYQYLGTVQTSSARIYVQGVRVICSSPCDDVVDGRTGNRFVVSGDFPGNYDMDVASSSGEMTLQIKPGSGALYTTGLIGIFVGGAGLAAGILTAITGALMAGTDEKNAQGIPTDPVTYNSHVDVQNIGIGIAVAGGVVLVGSIILRIVSRSSFDFRPSNQSSWRLPGAFTFR